MTGGSKNNKVLVFAISMKQKLEQGMMDMLLPPVYSYRVCTGLLGRRNLPPATRMSRRRAVITKSHPAYVAIGVPPALQVHLKLAAALEVEVADRAVGGGGVGLGLVGHGVEVCMFGDLKY